LGFFAKKTSKFGIKEGIGEECIYITKSFKEIGRLDPPVSS
jgi:hypothetical protein